MRATGETQSGSLAAATAESDDGNDVETDAGRLIPYPTVPVS
jgi:hypothetical protein